MATHNKHAATEDQIGVLHMAITRMFGAKADAILAQIELEPDSAIALVSGKDIGAMTKWVMDNGVTAIPAAQTEESELAKKLADIKKKSNGKVINFVKEA